MISWKKVDRIDVCDSLMETVVVDLGLLLLTLTNPHQDVQCT